MKYIIIQIKEGETPVLFPKYLFHDIVAEKFGKNIKVVSAGKVKLDNGKLECYGESTGLKIKSRGAVDTDIVEKHLKV
ncbi:MAG: hypothetical protein KAJ75_05040 [Alphaproteobacteria bacterium]|nr:hypothetical protein [Alphaproteobacteria bacterium]